ncbi:MAG: ABC transporter substrate-binding protein [Thalassobium sp.]|uniref:TRAP transporter substrate-binding protein n=1 Tax=Octadecabacter sp. SW4 TaxID=2602067 RepID=UPI000C0F1697|nr:twin-arginine translocation signal domain-containing protein [Octadecabacter sp. SW4]PHQ80658.1 MAG: ABC transporter substrate-binding protein [Thalassobium sp.]QEE35850.1 twin-arginine translocation signal domain-containing protein [Octadecabacter sp. SW4]
MDRRSFLKTSALGGTAAAATTLAAPAYAQGNRTLTMVTSVPDGFAVFDDAAVHFAELVTAGTGGALTIDKKPAGSLVGAFEVFDAVSAGQADIYHSADYYFGGQHPGFYFFTAVPFGATAQELATWYYQDGGAELHDELGEIFGLKSFFAGNTGAQPGGWFRKEINSADDLQGLKFRMPGLGGKALGLTGASVQNVPGGEIYQALSSGAIDGAEWIGPFADERLGLQEVCEFYYTGGMHEPGSALTASFNRDVWDSLSPEHQSIVETAAAATHQWSLMQSHANNGAALARLVSGGTKVLQFSDDIWDAFAVGAKGALDEFMGDELYARIRASFDTSVASSSAWIRQSDQAFTDQRTRIYG